MSIQSSVAEGTLTIAIDGRFDATSLDDFRKCYEDHTSSSVGSYIVDLADTVYLDSSALGMLLVLRDFAGGDQASVVIQNCSEEIKKIFAISNFSQLFDIQ
jgi:anti-anti-sigma factor